MRNKTNDSRSTFVGAIMLLMTRANRRFPGPVPFVSIVVIILLAATGLAIASGSDSSLVVPRFQELSDPDGRFANVNLGGPTDTTTNPFFHDLGSNGRRCVICHQASDAFSITPPHIRHRFETSLGADPLFRPVAAPTSPPADVSTQEDRAAAYTFLLPKALFGFGFL